MVKSFISVIISMGILIGGAIYEQIYLNNTFDELHEKFSVLDEKITENAADYDDVLSLQSLWIDKKQQLHVFIPHNEIKEVDLWVAEAVYYAKINDFKETKAKLSVTIELIEQIPKTFAVKFENVF